MKQLVMSIPEPTIMTPDNWTASCVITGHLVVELRVQERFRMAKHAAFIRRGREYMRKWNARQSEEALAETLTSAPVQFVRCLRQATKMGAWLTV